ncbi:hypothetical protein [Acholeplasma laidlawii]|uniref:hypothetical protein n=1 Tax=Acholeplasma laidlawii TaxID=2148 RepID=UPI003F8FCEE2
MSVISIIIMTIITLLRVRVILDNFGSEVNGVLQLSFQLIAYISLIESGLTAAYQINLYRAIKDNDTKSIYSLYLGMKKMLRVVGLKMIIIVLLITIITPLLVRSTEIDYIGIAIIIGLVGIRFISMYVFVFPYSMILSSFEKNYIVEIIQLTFNVITFILELFFILYLKLDYLVILIIPILSAIIQSLVLKKIIKIKLKLQLKDSLIDHEPDLTPSKMTKDILIHQVSSLIFLNTDNIIISSRLGLFSVTQYSSYNQTISYPSQFTDKILFGMKSTIGILINKNIEEAKQYIKNMLVLVSFLTTIFVTIFILKINNFITIWIGEEYLLDEISVFLFALILIDRIITPLINISRDNRGLFKESKGYTLIQAILNVVLSLTLAIFIGINGILLGTVISIIVISIPMNILIIERKVYNEKLGVFRLYLIPIAVSLLVQLLFSFLSISSFDITNLWIKFILETSIFTVTTVIISLFVYYILGYNILKIGIGLFSKKSDAR